MKSISELKEIIAILEKQNESLKIENAKLKEMTYIDNFTGCYNRTWFYENIFNDKAYYISVADINYLRTINFVLGHSEGDKLILESTQIFKKYGDVVRTGGDEFIIVSYNKNQFEELNKIVSNKFSIGGVYKPKNMLISHAIKLADKILFENKKYNKTGGAFED